MRQATRRNQCCEKALLMVSRGSMARHLHCVCDSRYSDLVICPTRLPVMAHEGARMQARAHGAFSWNVGSSDDAWQSPTARYKSVEKRRKQFLRGGADGVSGRLGRVSFPVRGYHSWLNVLKTIPLIAKYEGDTCHESNRCALATPTIKQALHL